MSISYDILLTIISYYASNVFACSLKIFLTFILDKTGRFVLLLLELAGDRMRGLGWFSLPRIDKENLSKIERIEFSRTWFFKILYRCNRLLCIVEAKLPIGNFSFRFSTLPSFLGCKPRVIHLTVFSRAIRWFLSLTRIAIDNNP